MKAIEDVDRPGIRIAVGLNSAYDLFLTRTIKNAQVVRARTGGGSAMIEMFLADKLDVVAGVKPVLVTYAKTNAAMRVMDGRFMVIQQSMGVPKGRTAAARYVRHVRGGREGVGLRRRRAQAQQPDRRGGGASRTRGRLGLLR